MTLNSPAGVKHDVILIGASVRAMAGSVSRAGLRPLCVDLFGDADLLTRHPDSLRCSIETYPFGFGEILRELPPLPVIYSGGLENYPELIAEIEKRHRVLGNSSEVLRRIRDPFQFHGALNGLGVQTPRTSESLPNEIHSHWLRKRRRSSAGRGIRFALPSDSSDDDHFFQEFIDGKPCSAIFAAPVKNTKLFGSGQYASTRLIGMTEQLVGCDWLNAKPFWYCGNIGPIEPSAEVKSQLQCIAKLGETFHLEGCFGVDFLLTERGIVPLEINPRFTASMELFERFEQGFSIFTDSSEIEASRGKCVGKAIWHTPCACRVMRRTRELLNSDFADIPHEGQELGAHEPLVSIFATASNRTSVEDELRRIAEEIPRIFQLREI